MSKEKECIKKEEQTPNDGEAYGCAMFGWAFLIYLFYCILSAFLILPSGWNLSEVLDNDFVVNTAAIIIAVILVAVFLWEARDSGIGFIEFLNGLKVAWKLVAIIVLVMIGRYLFKEILILLGV